MTLKWMLVPVLVAALLVPQAGAQETPALESQKEKVSYGIGVDVARNLKRQGVDVEADLMIRGMRDELEGRTLLIPDRELRRIMTAFQTELRAKQMQAAKVAGDENRKKGDAFLAENKSKAGVVTLPSGLQYRILKEGKGKKPTDNDSVVCHYRGTRIDGTEFDRSEDGKPATFKVTGVIPGYREALKLMPVGSRWQLFIPPQLAYGERGAGFEIGPNETLVFELELVAIK